MLINYSDSIIFDLSLSKVSEYEFYIYIYIYIYIFIYSTPNAS